MACATRPFDPIQLNRVFNGDEWALHFLCDKARVNLGYTFFKKTYAREVIKDVIAFVERQFDLVIFIGIPTVRKRLRIRTLLLGYAQKALFMKP
jgi:hypothetical protein